MTHNDSPEIILGGYSCTGLVALLEGPIRSPWMVTAGKYKFGTECFDAAAVDNQWLGSLSERMLYFLPEEYRLPIWFYHCEKMPLPEVAAILCLPEDLIRHHIAAGFEALRERLSQFGVHVTLNELIEVLSSARGQHAPSRLLSRISRLVTGI
jgi:hypothetical protein